MWKRALRLRGKDKEGARQYALQLFPHAHALLKRKKDHQRAEAALIAYVGIHHLMPARPEPKPDPTPHPVTDVPLEETQQ
jgi:crossover junction endodeoxyribonuclease RuvC